MPKTYGVEIHGRSVKINGNEVPNVASIHFSEDREHVSSTVVEVDGGFDFEGLSEVEFVFHPSSVEEAVRALKFYMQMEDEYRARVQEIIAMALGEYRADSVSDKRLAEIILSNVLDEIC